MLYYIPTEYIFKEKVKLEFKIRIPSLKKSGTAPIDEQRY